MKNANHAALAGICMTVAMMLAAPARGQEIWRELAPMPVANGGFACGFIGGQLLVVGGATWQGDVRSNLSQIWNYDPVGDVWSTIGMLKAPLAYSAFATTADGIVIAGGTGESSVSAEVLLVRGKIRRPLAQLAAPLVYAAGAGDDEHFYIVGGGSDAGDLRRLRASFTHIDTISGAVEEMPAYPGGRVMLAAMTSAGGDLYVFGGCQFDEQLGTVVNSRRAFVYLPHSRRWQEIAPLPMARRGITACAIDDDHILLAGGYGQLSEVDQEGFASDILLYSVSRNSYRHLATMPYGGMGIGLLMYGQHLYLFGGEDRMRHRSNALFRCDLNALIGSASKPEDQDPCDLRVISHTPDYEVKNVSLRRDYTSMILQLSRVLHSLRLFVPLLSSFRIQYTAA